MEPPHSDSSETKKPQSQVHEKRLPFSSYCRKWLEERDRKTRSLKKEIQKEISSPILSKNAPISMVEYRSPEKSWKAQANLYSKRKTADPGEEFTYRPEINQKSKALRQGKPVTPETLSTPSLMKQRKLRESYVFDGFPKQKNRPKSSGGLYLKAAILSDRKNKARISFRPPECTFTPQVSRRTIDILARKNGGKREKIELSFDGNQRNQEEITVSRFIERNSSAKIGGKTDIAKNDFDWKKNRKKGGKSNVFERLTTEDAKWRVEMMRKKEERRREEEALCTFRPVVNKETRPTRLKSTSNVESTIGNTSWSYTDPTQARFLLTPSPGKPPSKLILSIDRIESALDRFGEK